jgi:hypothetical protein
MFPFFNGNILHADAGSAVLFVCIVIPNLKLLKKGHHCLEMEQVSALDAAP